MADSVKKQQGKNGKNLEDQREVPRKKRQQEAAGAKKTEHGICREEQFFQKGTGTGL